LKIFFFFFWRQEELTKVITKQDVPVVHQLELAIRRDKRNDAIPLKASNAHARMHADVVQDARVCEDECQVRHAR